MDFPNKDVFFEVLGRGLFHPRSPDTAVADDHDTSLVVVDTDLVDQRVKRLGTFFEGLIVARHDHHEVFDMIRLNDLLSLYEVPESEADD